jgi:hypothetical protein
MRNNYSAEFNENNCYHIYNRCVGDAKMFRSEENYRYFLQQWQKYFGKYLATFTNSKGIVIITNGTHFQGVPFVMSNKI